MTTTKRPRGRPAGSGKKDEPLLRQVADLMVRAESNGTKLTATMAMHQALRARSAIESSHQSAVRRLQRKWARQKEGLLAAARHREAERIAPSRTMDISPVRRATDALIASLNRPMTASQQVAAMMNKNTSVVQALVNAIKPKNPMAEVMRQIFERDQRRRDLIDPPGLRAFRELNETLERITKAMRPPF